MRRRVLRDDRGPAVRLGVVRSGVTIGEIVAAGVVLLACFAAWERRRRNQNRFPHAESSVEESGVLVAAGETPVDDDVVFALIDAGRK